MANINIDQSSADAGIDNCSLVFINADTKLTMPMADPGADGLLGWDESAGGGDHMIFYTAGTGLEFSTTTLQIDSTVATLTGSQTLTNKTLTSPVLGGTVTGTYTLGGTITYDGQPALLAGRSGGQTLQGGTGSGEDLTLESTAHATKGIVTSADYVTLTGDGESTGQWPLTIGGAYTTDGSGITAQRWLGYAGGTPGTDFHLFATGGGDDWNFGNNGYYNGTAWVAPVAGSPSTLNAHWSGGEGFSWYTAAAGELPAPGWTHHLLLEGTTSTLVLTADDQIGTAANPTTGPSILIHGDWGDGTATTRPAQIRFIADTDANDRMEIGLDSNGVRDPFGVINVLTELGSFHNLHLMPGGGNVGIGAFSDSSQPAEPLDVIGNVKNTGYFHMAEMAAPGNPAANTGYLYVADNAAVTTLYFKDSAGTATNLLSAGGGLSDIVDDTTPQLGADLDGQGFDLDNMGVLFLTEQASANADVAGKGQLWVKTATPNVLMFTDDAGTDWEVSNTATITLSGVADDEILTYNSAGSDFINRTMHEWFTDVLTDPAADRLLFWDDSASAMAWNDALYLTETASGVNQITIASAVTTAAPVISATGTDANVGITLTPKGTGNVTLGTMVFDSDQSIGAGQDNYILTYDNGTGLISLEAASGGGANTALSNLAAVAINTSLISDTDITDDLGTGDIRWRDIHAETLNAGLTATDTLKLRGRDVDGAAYVDVLTITSANDVTADLNAITTIGGNAILDSTWTGSANIATVGTITTGTWTGTDIAVADGGTGASDAATARTNLGAIATVVEDTSPQLGGHLDVNGQDIGDGTRELIKFIEDASAVNEITIENEAAGSPPKIHASGDDVNINLDLVAKGSGVVLANSVEVVTISATQTLTNKSIAATQLTGQVALANGGTGANLSDPGADRIMFWDDSDTAVEWLDLSGLSIAVNTLSVDAATESASGAVELATAAEIDTGTDATRAVCPDQYQASVRNLRYISVVLVAPTTDVAVDTTDIIEWVAPFPGTIIQDDSFPDQFAAYTTTAGTTGTMVVDIHLNGTTIMTTNKLDIETTEKDTTTAATQPDLTTTSFVAGDVFTWHIDAIHTGTAAKGCHVNMTVRPT